jgi:hypothetical protein
MLCFEDCISGSLSAGPARQGPAIDLVALVVFPLARIRGGLTNSPPSGSRGRRRSPVSFAVEGPEFLPVRIVPWCEPERGDTPRGVRRPRKVDRMLAHRLWFGLFVMAVISSAVFCGCTKERSTDPWGAKNGGQDCMACHGDKALLQSLAVEEDPGEDPEGGGDG